MQVDRRDFAPPEAIAGALQPLGVPIAVISNASLVWRADVRADLTAADWVSLKVDAVDPPIWRALDRPHGSLSLDATLDGARAFARDFTGTLVSETMLVAGVDDGRLVAARYGDHTFYLRRLRRLRA